MKKILTLAWRNIWRNKRRTLITAASVFFAVLFSSSMKSLQKGAWNEMIKNVTSLHIGYAQVHANGFWEDRTINSTIDEATLMEELQSIPTEGLIDYLPRIESFALASSGEKSSAVLVVGADLSKEQALGELSNRMVEGELLTANEHGVILAEGLAKKLNLGLKDSLILSSIGYHASSAIDLYPIKGIISFNNPELNKQFCYLDIRTAQTFYGAEGMLTGMVLNVENNNVLDPIVANLKSGLDTETYEVMDWMEMMPDLMQAKNLDEAGSLLVLGILYIIITFGIFGTLLMMTRERQYEFGVLTAIGMRKQLLAFSVWLEIIFMGFVGAVAGILGSIPIVQYFVYNPIDMTKFSKDAANTYEKFGFHPVFPMSFDVSIFATQAIIVFFICTVLAIYPILVIRSLKPIQAMRK